MTLSTAAGYVRERWHFSYYTRNATGGILYCNRLVHRRPGQIPSYFDYCQRDRHKLIPDIMYENKIHYIISYHYLTFIVSPR